MGKHNYKGGKGPAPHIRSRTTRSSRGRLVTSDDTSNQQLSTQLSMLGLYAAPTVGDGNCLFRALSDQAHGSASLHAEVRRQVCDWIEAHGERYEGFVEVDEGEESEPGRGGKARARGKQRRGEGEGESEEGVEGKDGAGPSKRLQAYLRRMRENATYGGHMELSAFAHMTRRNIKVVQPGLVYVIEWRAGEPAPSEATPATPERRRSTRTPSVSAGGGTPRKARGAADEAQRVKTGHGYYVYEEVTSDEEEGEARGEGEGGQEGDGQSEARGMEDGGPTIYVAYHDWEHFSSIRNLRGPHSGLPNIRETPPQTADVPTPEEIAREAAKEAERERKRERERKERERKEKALLKVKLKIPPKSAAATPPPPSVVVAADPKMQHHLLPEASISSRSASPFPPSTQESAADAEDRPRPATPMHEEHTHGAHMRTAHARPPHLQGATPRAQYRSPKRTFDESSASGGEDEGREKRSRVRLGSVSLAGGPAAAEDAARGSMDLELEADPGAETPGLSAPSSVASSADSVSSESSSELSSPPSSSSSSPSPAPEPVIVAPPTPKTPSYHAAAVGEKALTRRQRKALGLPKPRKALGDTGVPGGRVSAGKIVIPGGRWTGRPAESPGVAVAGGGGGDADNEEWRRNGTGRLDVRGFRELKI